MAGPGIPAGERRDTACYLLDIYPTLFELPGLDVPGSVEGRSLVPALQDADERVRQSQFYAYRHFQRAVRVGRHKLIEYNVAAQRTTQLFDLQADPWEVENRADDPNFAEELNALRAELERWQKEVEDPNAEAFRG